MGNYSTVGKQLNFFERCAEKRKKAAQDRELANFRYDCCNMIVQLRKRGYQVEANAIERVLLGE